LLRTLFAIAVLVPTSVLFIQVWRNAADKETTATRERHGVSYLVALTGLTRALAQTQAAAVSGQPPAGEVLTAAMDTVAVVDQRYGDELRTHERWSDLRVKLQGLPRSGATPAAVDAAYGTAGDLLVTLYLKVQNTASLVQDPATDSHFLQAAATIEIPQTVVSTARLVDLAVIAASQSTAPVASLIEMAGVRSDVLGPAAEALADLTSAGEATSSATLGGGLLGVVDKYQLAIQTLTALTEPEAIAATVRQKLAALAQARDDLVVAASSLSLAVLTELDKLLASRIDDQRPQREFALGVAAVAVLLALIPVVTGLTGRRRRPTGTPPRPRPLEPEPVEPVQPEMIQWRERSGAAR
jgi:hypothetical protein